MSSPANRRSAGSRRFNPLKALQPKRRLQQMLSSPSPPVRTAAPVSTRDPYGNTSLSSSSNSGSCKGSDGSPTPRRHMKYTSCTDNHGIRPPPPEQYLTPLQQKEVCIRHLRARLKETIDRLQNRDTEIGELRTQLSRMQEDWIEEECHRVEAQLALKEARKEIQQLKQVIDVVWANLSDTDTDTGAVQKYFQDINVQNLKLESLLCSMELAQNGSAKEDEAAGGGARAAAGSCEGSPAHSVTRSSTYTKLNDQALADRNGNAPDFPGLSGEETQDSGCVCGDSHGDLLLEAAFLSEETASLLSTYSRMPHSSTYEKLCTTEKVLPRRCSSASASSSHPCLSHHHLFLHHLREQSIQTDCGPAYNPDLDPINEKVFKSQACSPTYSWLSEEGEDFDTVTTATATAADPELPALPSSLSCACIELPPLDDDEAEAAPQTCQPRSATPPAEHSGVTVVEMEDDEDGDGTEGDTETGEASTSEAPQRSYWSRHFLVDLLAVAMPVVPAMAWLCRAPRRGAQPVYNIGSLLRGCCTVALHSLRRSGSNWHYPAGTGGARGSQI
ncbi:hypothetical protein SKAU_G00107840 [Synaphobranchus kaupii]|uniref:Syntaphilin n=1 Tax=Synaphobranchus kaupii TaxID=118154 RepID=A0A9Q1J822_SYNKA|nr:hypothetical protein SKAU_G00107840 [Synaphobranchus kaupii]